MNSLILIIRYFVISVISIVTVKYSLSFLGDKNYGYFTVFSSTIMFCGVLNTIFVTSLNRFSNFHINDKIQHKIYFRHLFYSNFILSIVSLIVMVVLGFVLISNELSFNYNAIGNADIQAFFIFAVIAFLNAVTYPFQSVLLSKDQFTLISILDTTKALLNFLVFYFLLKVKIDHKLLVYSLIYLIISLLFIIGLVIFVLRKYMGYLDFKCNFNSIIFREIYNLSGWNSFGSVASILETTLPVLLISKFYGARSVSFFGIANQSVGALKSLIGAVSSAYGPLIIRNFSSGYSNVSFYISSIISKTILLVYSVAAIFLFNECESIFTLWLNSDTMLLTRYFRFLLIIGFFTTAFLQYSPLIQASGKVKKFMLFAFGLNVISLFLVWVFYLLKSSIEIYFIVMILNGLVSNFGFLYLSKKVLGFNHRLLFVYYSKAVTLFFIYLWVTSRLKALFTLPVVHALFLYIIVFASFLILYTLTVYNKRELSTIIRLLNVKNIYGKNR